MIQDESLPGIKVVTLPKFSDERGYFAETYRQPLYESLGISTRFVQDNHSFSRKGVIRGMHFQSAPGQDKLITVMRGKIFDVFVDIRLDSPHFGMWGSRILSGKKGEQLLIPKGFAHGFAVLEEAHVVYKVSSIYDPREERTFCYSDPEVGILWPIKEPILSEKDRSAPMLQEVLNETVDMRSGRPSR